MKTFTLIYRGLALGTRRNCIAVFINMRAEDLPEAEEQAGQMAEHRQVELDDLIQHCETLAHGGMSHMLIADNHAVVGCSAGGIIDLEPETAKGMPIILRRWEEDDTFEDDECSGHGE